MIPPDVKHFVAYNIQQQGGYESEIFIGWLTILITNVLYDFFSSEQRYLSIYL